MTSFGGSCAVITGAGTGIGLATARLLARHGATVVMAGRDGERGEREAAGIRAAGADARFVVTDVTDDAQVARLADDAAGAHGRIDLWFGNAGVEGPIGDMSDWDDAGLGELLAVNVKAVLSGLRHATARMRAGALVLNTASFVGTLMPVPIAIPYGATKAAVVAAGEAAAAALEPRGIRVATVCPWVVDTPMVDRLTGGAGPAARAEFAAGFNPGGRLTPAEDVARAVADLWTRSDSLPSGAAYLVDAGPTLTRLVTTALAGRAGSAPAG